MRYFCHHCHTQIPADELLPEFTCPSCHSGFIEEMPNVTGTSTGAASSRRNSDAHQPDEALAGFISTRMSSDELSDDNSEVEFLDAVNGPLAQVFNLFQPQLQAAAEELHLPGQPANQTGSSTSEANSNQTPQQANRRITRSSGRVQGRVPGAPRLPLHRQTEGTQAAAYSATNQSLADVLNDFMTGATFGTQYTEGSSSGPQAAGGSGTLSANRGLINIDFPIPFFLHSNPGDYAWGNAGFDAVITQLLNNLDGSNTGPPPMPTEQVQNLPTVKISDEQVRNTNLQCTVCMDDFQVGDSARQLPCEHFFHQDCILPWLELHASCPICRKTFASGANSSHNVSATDPQSDSSNISVNANLSNRSTTGSSATTATSATATPATAAPTTATTTTTNRSTASATSASVHQSSAPRYDYTEDDCD